MAKVERFVNGYLGFNCPGCKKVHTIRIAGPNAWQWNNDLTKPTVQPSVLHKAGHFLSDGLDRDCWCTFEERFGRKPDFACVRCHSFIRDGNIEFLADCSHELAGQTVPLPDYTGAL